MKSKVLIILAMTLIYPGYTAARGSRDIISRFRECPVSFNLQYAGNVGLLSVGSGIAIEHPKIYLGLIYGYLPKAVNDAEVHTFALKTYYRFYERSLSDRIYNSVYAGTNIDLGITHNTYLKYPDYFPDDYYMTNAVHFAPFIGQKTDFAINSRLAECIGIYAELGTLDSYFYRMMTSHQIPVYKIFNLCAGISITLRIDPDTK